MSELFRGVILADGRVPNPCIEDVLHNEPRWVPLHDESAPHATRFLLKRVTHTVAQPLRLSLAGHPDQPPHRVHSAKSSSNSLSNFIVEVQHPAPLRVINQCCRDWASFFARHAAPATPAADEKVGQRMVVGG